MAVIYHNRYIKEYEAASLVAATVVQGLEFSVPNISKPL
jgi:hypothetical protein